MTSLLFFPVVLLICTVWAIPAVYGAPPNVVSTPEQLAEALSDPGTLLIELDKFILINSAAWTPIEVARDVLITAKGGGGLDLAHGGSGGLILLRCRRAVAALARAPIRRFCLENKTAAGS